MQEVRYLIVNADDFGQSPGVNRGVAVAHESGIVTSSSLMVCWPHAPEAAAYAKEHGEFSVGLHVDLGEWKCKSGVWAAIYERVDIKNPDAVADEISRQLTIFRNLLGKDPTHIDSHQHIHLNEPVHSVLLQLSNFLNIPLRHFCSQIRHCGDFYGQSAEGAPLPELITVDGLIKLLAELPSGITELGCHPADSAADLDTMYREERRKELETLCDPRVANALTGLGIELCSFQQAGCKISELTRHEGS